MPAMVTCPSEGAKNTGLRRAFSTPSEFSTAAGFKTLLAGENLHVSLGDFLVLYFIPLPNERGFGGVEKHCHPFFKRVEGLEFTGQAIGVARKHPVVLVWIQFP